MSFDTKDPVGERVPLEIYRRESGYPFVAKALGLDVLYSGDEEIRSYSDELEMMLADEIASREWTPDAASAQSLLDEMMQELGGNLDNVDSYRKLERLLSLSRIHKERRKLKGLLDGGRWPPPT
jgi:hypothetical protein